MAAPHPQPSQPFRSPPRWLVPWITKVQVWLYERSNGRFCASGAGMRNLLLRSVGRRTGRTSTVCLPYWRDAEGRRIVVASFAGGPRNPGWYHNLKDKAANPEVVVRDGQRVFRCVAEVLTGEERSRIWAQLTADRPFYRDYQAQTSRTIPLVRLVETAPDAP